MQTKKKNQIIISIGEKKKLLTKSNVIHVKNSEKMKNVKTLSQPQKEKV
jgi:hypothetical protein